MERFWILKSDRIISVKDCDVKSVRYTDDAINVELIDGGRFTIRKSEVSVEGLSGPNTTISLD